MTCSDQSDPDIKVWDLNAILNPSIAKKNAVMLVGVLKGHSNKIIGCEFLGGKNILSVDESGVLNVFNLGVSQPIASQMISKATFKEVTFFSNKKQFALLTNDNRIFIIQVQQVNLTRKISNTNSQLQKNSFYQTVNLVVISEPSEETPTSSSLPAKVKK